MFLSIPPSWYFWVYIAFISILVLIKIIPSGNSNLLSYEAENKGYVKTITVGVILIIFFGLRDPIDNGLFFGDTKGYATAYEMVQDGTILPTTERIGLEEDDKLGEIGFLYIRDIMAQNQMDVSLWFIVVAAISIIPTVIALHKLFPGHEYLAFLFWICSFGFYGGLVNGLRNANAVSIFFLGFVLIILYLNKFKEYKIQIILGIIFCIAAYYFHHSIVILWISFPLALFVVKNTKSAILIWFAAIIASLIFGNTLADMAVAFDFDDRAEQYLIGGEDSQMMEEVFSQVGFRWDFLIFSAMPIILGYYVTVVKGIKNRTYQILLNTYIIANAIWIIFMYAAFTNRFASLSWSLYPFVLCYPMVKFKIYPNSQATATGWMLVGLIIFVVMFS